MIILGQAVLIAVLELALQSWAWVALVPLAFGLASGAQPLKAAGRGAAAGLISWLGAGLFFYMTSGLIIAGRMSAMFGLGRSRGWLMVIITGLAGAMVAGLAAFAGASLREAMGRKHEEKD